MGVRFLTKLMFYEKTNPELYGTERPRKYTHQNDAEISILGVLREKILDPKVSPCIVRMESFQVCKNLLNILTPEQYKRYSQKETSHTTKDLIYRIFCEKVDQCNRGLSHNKYAFVALEPCSESFTEYLKTVHEHRVELVAFKTLLFQIIYTLYAIRQVFPLFTHGDFHTDNILMKYDNRFELDVFNPKFLLFKTNKGHFLVPYFGYICKIIDFGFSAIPELNIISDIMEDQHMMYHREGITDISFLLSHIYGEVESSKNINRKILSMLMDLDPSKCFEKRGIVADKNAKALTVDNMLDNKLWDIYRNKPYTKNMIYETYDCTSGRH
jgi:serine/threonine protein kinase